MAVGYDVASLVRKAFNNVASISKGESGFRAAGIFPLNPEVFTEDDFISADILQSESIPQSITIQDCNKSLTITTTISGTSKKIHSSVPSTSKQTDTGSQDVDSHDSEPNILSPVSGAPNQIRTNLHDLIKLPEKTPNINTRNGRKKQHATILTSTPNKEILIARENKNMKKTGTKENSKIWKGKGQGKKTTIQKKSPEKAKRQILQQSNATSASNIGTTDLCLDNEDDCTEDAGNKCLVCNDYGKNNEMWFRCTSCGLWAHAKCTGWNSTDGYICDMC